jgi:putative endonuclease
MKPIGTHNYFVYITTNTRRNVLYIGMTNDLQRRLEEHEQDAKSEKKHFTGKYQVYLLIYWERFEWIHHAIEREKELKGWTRAKKEKLIAHFNPDWDFLNKEIG